MAKTDGGFDAIKIEARRVVARCPACVKLVNLRGEDIKTGRCPVCSGLVNIVRVVAD